MKRPKRSSKKQPQIKSPIVDIGVVRQFHHKNMLRISGMFLNINFSTGGTNFRDIFTLHIL